MLIIDNPEFFIRIKKLFKSNIASRICKDEVVLLRLFAVPVNENIGSFCFFPVKVGEGNFQEITFPLVNQQLKRRGINITRFVAYYRILLCS